MRLSNPWVAGGVVFIASFCTLVVELIAGRIMAPYIGVSLYTWTSIIGVCLAGISLGNYVGGRIADRAASNATLGVLFLLSGGASLAILAAVGWFVNSGFLPFSTPLMVRIVVYTTGVFFLPTFLMGTISPVVIKLSLVDLNRTGSIVGRLYAISTVGAIFGTFVTGFYLIEAMGTRSIVWTVSIVLLAVGLIIGQFWKVPARSGAAIAFTVAFLSIFYYYRENYVAPCVHESSYFCIRISEATIDGRSVKSLVLDHLVHSYVDLDDPKFIGYGYERVYAELTEWRARDNPRLHTLSIGGGGYTFPKHVAATYPFSEVDVLEIDPAVTRAAQNYLNLPLDSRVTTYNQDARIWFIENQPVDRYDMVYGDAFNDLSVPYHLTSLEFDQMVKQSMRSDGLLLTNIIDNWREGEFLRAYLKTLSFTFPHIYLFSQGPSWDGVSWANTWIAAASKAPLDLEGFREFEGAIAQKAKRTAVLDDARLKMYLQQGRDIVLTDDYVPVDNLVARLFADRGF